MRHLKLIALVASLFCTACASTIPPSSALPDPSLIRAASQEYRLGPGDKVRIAVFGQENLSGEFDVGPQGAIAYPLIGDVPASGRTLTELSATIGESLRDGYVQQPDVRTEIVAYRPFYILGEVNEPGTYAYSAGLTVMSAVATAGGFTYRANSRQVFIRHAGEAVEHRYPVTNSTPIQPGDVVRISERMF